MTSASTESAEIALRAEIIATCMRVGALGINQGSAGNLSARLSLAGGPADFFLVTPTGLPYEATEPENIVAMTLDGTVFGARAPSTEWRFHRDIFRARSDVGAVLHLHSPFATALACLHLEIPAFHYMVAVAGGDTIRCARYATFGTQELSDNALRALEGRRACLLANHGLIATGETVGRALALAVEVEALAAQFHRVLQLGRPKILGAAEMALIIEKFKSYGRPR